MANKKISVIIPVYNVEKYIRRCLDSILDQTFKDYELILVNDGSKDDSLKIIKEYEQKYQFIKVFSQKNSGPAIARNNGIKKATGKYIMFIDSDDYIDMDYIQTYYNHIKNTDYDVVMGGFRKTDGKQVSFQRQLKNGEFSKYIVAGPVAKIYRLDYIQNNKIFFLDTNASEDVYFNLKVINLGAKIKTIEYIGYNYFDNLNSVSNTIHKGFNSEVKFIELLNEINYTNSPNILLNQYFIIRYCIWYLLYSGKNTNKELFLKEYRRLFDWIEKNIPNYEKNKYIRLIGPKGEIKKIGAVVYIFILLHKFNLVRLFCLIYCKGEN